jgi:predicted amidophosphoribosyltransferase
MQDEQVDRPPFGCPVCGQLLSGPGPCPNWWCRRGDRWWSVVFVVAAHQAAWRHALVRYKYGDERHRAGAFAEVLARFLDRHATWFEEFEMVAGVPAFTGPGSARGWDPVGRILSELTPRLGPGWQVAPRLVIKTRQTPRMQGLSWPERQRVAAGPLRASLAVPDKRRLAGARVLVLDDVLTEGSTLREVARSLRLAGAAEVAGLVLARPPWVD